MIPCADQAELDYYYDKLSAKPEAEMCGWVTDQFGVSWQLIPRNFTEYMRSGESEKKSKLMKALMEMKKLTWQEIEDAYNTEAL
jgi:predicted 3-demethylubiquinone-9 3-methyltransferase (glyoxalase superfamily)